MLWPEHPTGMKPMTFHTLMGHYNHPATRRFVASYIVFTRIIIELRRMSCILLGSAMYCLLVTESFKCFFLKLKIPCILRHSHVTVGTQGRMMCGGANMKYMEISGNRGECMAQHLYYATSQKNCSWSIIINNHWKELTFNKEFPFFSNTWYWWWWIKPFFRSRGALQRGLVHNTLNYYKIRIAYNFADGVLVLWTGDFLFTTRSSLLGLNTSISFSGISLYWSLSNYGKSRSTKLN